MKGALGLAIAVGFVPSASFLLDRADAARAERRMVQAVFAVDGPGRVVVTSTGTSFVGTSPPAPATVRALLDGDVRSAARSMGVDLAHSAWSMGPEGPALVVGVRRASDPGPRILLHPERFVPLGARAPGLEIDLLGVDGLASSYGLPEVVRVRSMGRPPWAASLVERPSKRPR